MRAWVLDAPGPLDRRPLSLRRFANPERRPGEVVVRVSACGLCRTDIHVVRGEIPLPRLPIVPGHQAVGTVIHGGTRFREGDRVGVAWLRSTCGACADCLRGDENLCRKAAFTGYHAHGGYAERVAVPEDYAYAIPEGLSDDEAAPLLCAGIIGYRALKQADVRAQETVGLYGFGSSAHVALQVAKHWRCRVFVVTRGERHRDLARTMGADWVGDSDEAPPEPMDRAVVFAPAGPLVLRALESVRWGGTVASACIHMSPIPSMDYSKHLFGERTLRSTTANTRKDGEELLAIAAAGALRPHVTTFPFEDVHDGLLAMDSDRLQGSAVLRVVP